MCLCWPFHDYVVKKAPEPKPKKEPEELQYHVVQPGDTFYPVNPGQATASTATADHDFNGEPTVYQYNPPTQPTVTAAPSAPAAPAAQPGARANGDGIVYVHVPPDSTPMSFYAINGNTQPPAFAMQYPQPTAIPMYQTPQQSPPPAPPAPPGVVPWQGPTSAEITERCMPKTMHYIPYNPPTTSDREWYCKELDGSYSIRGTTDIMQNCQPGRWALAKSTNHPYFIREPASSGS